MEQVHADTAACSPSLIDLSDRWPGVTQTKTGAKRQSSLIGGFFWAQAQIICCTLIFLPDTSNLFCPWLHLPALQSLYIFFFPPLACWVAFHHCKANSPEVCLSCFFISKIILLEMESQLEDSALEEQRLVSPATNSGSGWTTEVRSLRSVVFVKLHLFCCSWLLATAVSL